MVKEFNKSLSNTSTTSIESGIFDVDFEPDDAPEVVTQPISETVKEILHEARSESRLVCGWKNVISHLNETEYPESSLFFFLVPNANNGDCISHIQEVMMKAFCLDNDIYVIQLDSVEKLNSIIGSAKSENHQCALVQRSSVLKCLQDEGIDLEEFTELENALIDYCEEFWSEPVQPIIRLPEK